MFSLFLLGSTFSLWACTGTINSQHKHTSPSEILANRNNLTKKALPFYLLFSLKHANSDAATLWEFQNRFAGLSFIHKSRYVQYLRVYKRTIKHSSEFLRTFAINYPSEEDISSHPEI